MKAGEIELQVETLDDLWQLYNIIEPEDLLSAHSFRRIKQSKETLRPDSGDKVRIFLQIQVSGAEFHPFSNRLRVKGQIREGPMNLITLDSYHTINIEVNSQLVLKKFEWSKFHLKRLEDAVADGREQQILVTVVDEREASIALVTNIGIKMIAHIEENIPGKYFKISYHSQSLQNFYHEIGGVLAENCNNYPIQAIIIAGPGFAKEHLINYLRQKVPEIKVSMILEAASSANKSGIYEVVKRGATSKILGKLRLSQENDLVDEVLRRLGKNQTDVSYGFSEIKKVAQTNAIETLLVTDIFLREQPVERRKELDDLIRSVEYNQGKITIISTLHPAGEQLSSLGGIAALLRFPLPSTT